MWIRAAALFALGAGAAAAAEDGAPLSAIDWLSQNPAPVAAAPVIAPPPEPDVAGSAAVPTVTVTPLEGAAPRQVGLVPGDVTGLPASLWRGADGARTAARLERLRVPSLPAAQALLYKVLLAEADPPSTGAGDLIAARIDTLMRMGALEPALALARQAGPPADVAEFERFFDAALLAGQEPGSSTHLPLPPICRV